VLKYNENESLGEIVIRKKTESAYRARACTDARMTCIEKEVVQTARQRAKCALQLDRGRRRDEKRAGRAGPPDCGEVPGPQEVLTLVIAHVEPLEREAVDDWDVVGKDDIASAEACQRPSISRCSVS
jgi:hypothetical protein